MLIILIWVCFKDSKTLQKVSIKILAETNTITHLTHWTIVVLWWIWEFANTIFRFIRDELRWIILNCFELEKSWYIVHNRYYCWKQYEISSFSYFLQWINNCNKPIDSHSQGGKNRSNATNVYKSKSKINIWILNTRITYI